MRKRTKALVFAACLAAAAALIAFLAIANWGPRRDGPSYNGQSLYHWLHIEVKSGTELLASAQAAEACKAVMQIGTNGLPWLVSCVRHTPDPSWRKYVDFIHKLPPFLNYNHFLCRYVPGQEADYRSGLAIEGFRLLGTNALPALPELTTLMNTGGTSAPARYALFSISHMGQPALPTIVAVITNRNHPQRGMAVGVIGSTMWYLGTNAAQAVPALMQCANDPDRNIARAANFALGFILSSPKPEGPQLPNNNPGLSQPYTNAPPR